MARHVFIAMPLPKGAGIQPGTMSSMEICRDELKTLGITSEVAQWIGMGVHTARNMLVAKFLASKATDLFWWDSDLGAPQGAMLKLLNHPVDIVAVPYPMPKDPESYIINHPGNRPRPRDPATGLIWVNGLGLGFSRMKRSAIERMIERYGHRKYRPEYSYENLEAWSLFDFEFRGADFGEDMTFCQRWADIGGQIWIDPDIRLSHVGPKTYEGCYATFLETRPGLAAGAAGDLMRAIDGGATEADVLKAAQQFLASKQHVVPDIIPCSPPVSVPGRPIDPRLGAIIKKIDDHLANKPKIELVPTDPPHELPHKIEGVA